MAAVPQGFVAPEFAPKIAPNLLPTTATPSQETGRDPPGADKSMSEMNPQERADYAQEISDMGVLGKAAIGFMDMMTNAATIPSTAAHTFMSLTGIPSLTMATDDLELAKAALAMTPAQMSVAMAQHNATAMAAAKAGVVGFSKAAAAAALSNQFGATATQIAAHVDAVGRGNAPAGSSPNSMGGYSTTGTHGHSTNSVGDVVGAAAAAQATEAAKLGITMTQQMKDDVSVGVTNKDLEKAIDRELMNQVNEASIADPADIGASKGKPGTGPVGAMSGMDQGPAPDPGVSTGASGTGPPGATSGADQGPSDTSESGLGETTARGGLIQRPKRKAKNTKKKRRGLASR
jgi:hypothetical protein